MSTNKNEKSGHTPGPWTLHEWRAYEGEKEAQYVITAQGVNIARPLQYEPDSYANARLIAAAPDLLAACANALVDLDSQAAIDSYEYGETYTATRAQLRAAIAKAEGR